MSPEDVWMQIYEADFTLNDLKQIIASAVQTSAENASNVPENERLQGFAQNCKN